MTALFPRVHHKATPFRRLLLEVFLVGYRPVPEQTPKSFLRCKEPLNELHYLVQENERNCRYPNAKEYAWLNSFTRGLHPCLEANVSDHI